MSRRTEQVAELIKQEVGTLIQRELRDPRLGFVTITRVEVSADMGHARIYVGVIGEEEVKQESLKVLKHASSYLRRELSSLLKMRYVPQLEFHFDVGIEHGEKIQRLLRQLEQEEKPQES